MGEGEKATSQEAQEERLNPMPEILSYEMLATELLKKADMNDEDAVALFLKRRISSDQPEYTIEDVPEPRRPEFIRWLQNL
jgi:hypothetical protein